MVSGFGGAVGGLVLFADRFEGPQGSTGTPGPVGPRGPAGAPGVAGSPGPAGAGLDALDGAYVIAPSYGLCPIGTSRAFGYEVVTDVVADPLYLDGVRLDTLRLCEINAG